LLTATVVLYILGRLLLLPARLVFHTRLAKPGVKALKRKDPSVLRLWFANLAYARLFRAANG
jgi:hypothetical protein